ncbi:hypothetical protein L1987_23284 [Smallanthus sonchifolius]|uniref:Uncharacterized protein n=1 Tax=Smallanthus sonchifolius TaxID=185202 RepID=A0ACB9IJV0_9ASTR|nr:hypothetical protein L1987_23284 [Smallanthus sonchifolius]
MKRASQLPEINEFVEVLNLERIRVSTRKLGICRADDEDGADEEGEETVDEGGALLRRVGIGVVRVTGDVEVDALVLWSMRWWGDLRIGGGSGGVWIAVGGGVSWVAGDGPGLIGH